MTERERALLMGKKISPLTANESSLAYAVAHGGGSEPTYETVAEIEVGTMVEDQGLMAYVSDVPFPTFDGQIYFNSVEYPLSPVPEAGGLVFSYNIDAASGEKEDPNKPLYMFVGNGGAGGSAVCSIATSVDDPDLSNTTVHILKKVEQGGGELPEVTSADNGDVLTVVNGAWDKAEPSGGGDVIVATADLSLTEGSGDVITAISVSNLSITYDEIASADKPVIIRATLNDGDVNRVVDFVSQDSSLGSTDEGRIYFFGHLLTSDENYDGIDAYLHLDHDDSIGVDFAYVKGTYEFGITITPTESGFDAVGAEETHNDAIKAALAITPNVFAKVTVGGTIIRVPFSLEDSTCTACGVVWMGLGGGTSQFYGVRANVGTDTAGGVADIKVTITPLE